MNKLVYRTTGRYYLGSSEESAQYVFSFRDDAPKELKRSFLVNIDKDGNFSGSALDVARDIQAVFDDYWLHTGKESIAAVVDYLERWEEKDTYDALLEEYEKLSLRLGEIDKELEQYDEEEMKNWTPAPQASA